MPANPKIELKPGNCYHIFNRGNNRRLIFGTTDEYEQFILYLKKYIATIAWIYAYALLPDHFHLVVTIKDKKLWPKVWREKPGIVARSFGLLQNAYAKYYLYRHREQVSGLFERSFERILVDNDAYFKNLILYMHKNPLKYGQAVQFEHYPWTSYHDLCSNENDTFLDREYVWSAFRGRESFIKTHAKLDRLLWDDPTVEF